MATTQIDPKWLMQLCDASIKAIKKEREAQYDAFMEEEKTTGFLMFKKTIKRKNYTYRDVFERSMDMRGVHRGLRPRKFSDKIGLYPEEALLYLVDVCQVAIDGSALVTIDQNECRLVRALERKDYDWF